jgi:DNA-binding transcriptional ArsR family regulator
MPDKLPNQVIWKSIPLPQTDELLLRKAHYLLRALDHDLRIRMLHFLNEKQQCTVTEVFLHFRLVQAVASQHLAILRRAGVVQTTRKGKNVFYKPNYSRLNEVLELVARLASGKTEDSETEKE